ncbi:para-aminobenzoate synthetase component 1 [Spirosoma lacussanchae]|uniref:aminodeoxychorismate synthase component I n=1 Tax=Spirosoma lacussanchae TaxID=1884249 RepID=UPI0011096015|nr:aminodeoxychorismate synthase component I [Spirosoma lacussanchae]
MREARVTITDGSPLQWQALKWAMSQPSPTGTFVASLTNNGIMYPNDPFPNRLFVGAKRVISFSEASQETTITTADSTRRSAGSDVFEALYEAHRQQASFLVGYFSYDLKNQLEKLNSRHPNRLGFPDAYFVEPAWVIDIGQINGSLQEITVRGEGDARAVMAAILAFRTPASEVFRSDEPAAPAIQCRVTPEAYLNTVRQIQQLIRDGDVYELNYCIEFFLEKARLDPLRTYQALTERSPMPFSSFLRLDNRYVLGASPERFLKKTGSRILSQPIKGTIRRGQTTDEDAELRSQLFQSEKERAENLMIVDLVRNDLARSAETGSVRVDELFGIYGFRQVYQMISTVSATLRNDVSWADSIRNAFPMGSMTGAPKIRAMERIDQLEASRRGVYSGAIGYITPDGDFDFNVVIRSLLYDAEQRYASFSVGSAITYDADPDQEWAECLLKASAIREVLEQTALAG